MNNQFVELKKKLPMLGVGLGYRHETAQETMENAETIDFVEIISEMYLRQGAAKMQELDDATKYKVIPHGVDLSIGSTDEICYEHLHEVKHLIERLQAPWWTDHLAFGNAGGLYSHSLLPLPYSREAINHVVKRIKKVQQVIDVPLLLENITTYIRMPGSELTEAQFISEVLEQADCGLLLDVNNVYVNSQNHNYDPYEFINQLPIDRVVQIHIAGHHKKGDMLIDTHGSSISKPVFDLLEHTLRKTDVRGILLERDQLFPKFSSTLKELHKIRSIAVNIQPELALKVNKSDQTKAA